MKKCSRCHKEKVTYNALGLNKAGLLSKTRKSKLIHFRLCKDCIIGSDVIFGRCSPCEKDKEVCFSCSRL